MRAVVLFLVLCQSLSAYKILVLFPHPGKSHFDVFLPMLKFLSEKGHQVTVVSHFPQPNQTDNYRDVSLKGTTITLLDVIPFSMVSGARIEKYTGALFIDYLAKFTCPAALQSTQVHQLLRSEEKYDVILIEMFNSHCFAAFIEKFKAPFIGLSSHVLMPWTNDWFANPDNPAYIPVLFMDYSDQMNFMERVENTVMSVFNKIFYKYFVTSDSSDYSKKYLGIDVPKNIMYNASAVLVNSHFTLNGPRPVVPGIIEVAGMHIGKPKPVPEVRAEMLSHEANFQII